MPAIIIVPLQSNNVALTVPSTVTVDAGTNSASFTATAATLISSQSVTISATSGLTVYSTVSLMTAVGLSGVVCPPGKFDTEGAVSCTVTLTAPSTSGITMSVDSSTGNVRVPTAFSIPAGQSSQTFQAYINAVEKDETARITVSWDGTAKSTLLQLTGSPWITNLLCTPNILATGGIATCTVMLSKPSQAIITLNSTPASALTTPDSIAAQGASSITFQIIANTMSSQTAAMVTASLGASAARTPVTISPATIPDLSVPAQVTGKTLRMIQFSAIASDPSGLPVTVAGSNLPLGAIFSDGTFTWTPTNDQAGTYVVAITASNSVSTSTIKNVTIIVTARKPLVSSISNAANPGQANLQDNPGTASTPCSPGSFATLAGVDLTSQDPQVSQDIPMLMTLAGLQVLVNGDPAPLSYASDSAVTFQCPMLDPGSPLLIQVRSSEGALSNQVETTMQEVTPGLYSMDSTGQGQGTILIAATNEIAMESTAGVPSRPASPGEVVIIFANGLGAVDNPVAAGSPAPSDVPALLLHTLKVVIGGEEVDPVFAGLAVGVVGLDQLNVQLPDDVSTGSNIPVYLKVSLSDGSTVTSNQVTMAIQSAEQPNQ